MQKLTQSVLMLGAAAVTVGAFATALIEEKAGIETVTPAVLSSGGMTVGETATTTTEPPSAPMTSVAEPVLKADVPCGFTASC
ncbi:MAG: hypothetical protein QOK02_4519 [Mycobacterium sp.]|nr:hypothetical protein [Mycobacterium sp.]